MSGANQWLQLPAFNAVAANGTATCDLLLGRDYYAVHLELSDANGTPLANNGLSWGDIKVLVNENIQRQCSAFQLVSINGAQGLAWAVKTSGTPGNASYRTYIDIWFAEPWRKNTGDVNASAWHANGINSFQIQVDIKNLTTPVIGGWYEFSPSVTPMGPIVKYLRNTYNASGSQLEVTNLSRRDLYQSMHFFPTSDGHYVQQMRFTMNGTYVREKITKERNIVSLLGREMNPDTSGTPRYDLVFDYDDPINNWLQAAGARDLSFFADLDAASTGTMDVVTVRTGGLE